MGREIRMVEPNWRHPRDDSGRYIPLYDKEFDSELENWISEYRLWKAGEHPDQKKYPDKTDCPYWEWNDGPPNPEYYRPAFKENPTWYQAYETVSEGTPVTPPFETKQELVEHLVNTGSEWDGKWSREAAEGFVEREWAPSGMMQGGKFFKSSEIVL